MFNIANIVRDAGGKVLTFSTYRFSFKKYSEKEIPGHKYYGSRLESNIHYLAGRLLARNGYFSHHATKKLIQQIDKFNPDIIHLHNLHSFCINLSILFNYLKNKKVVWTLHDCWAFTGHCAHFTISGCHKWKIGCNHCRYYKQYPKVSFDRSAANYRFKKKLFTQLKNLTIVTPSNWLANLVKESFLKSYPVRVINNGVDLDIFKPSTTSNIDYQRIFKGKHIILGVSFVWEYSKGLDIFEKLCDLLPDDYLVVLVGGQPNDVSNKKIFTIPRTNSQAILAELYSVADVFLNPTREDTFPTVNIESLACGTPVITFDSCGSPEIIDETCGIVLRNRNMDNIVNTIKKVCIEKPFSKEACLIRASRYEKKLSFNKYLDLFNEKLILEEY